MGKCMSCCAMTPGYPAASSDSGLRVNTPIQSTGLGDFQSTAGKEVKGDSSEKSFTTGRTPVQTLEKKMFTPYHPKLPPIKKSNSGEKRVSLISREFSEVKIQALYEQYKDSKEDAILPEGIEKFCMDLEVKPDEFIVLVVAWKFQAQTMCRFSREEFFSGCRALKVDSIKGIQSKFSELLNEVKNRQSFKELYRWTYRFGLDFETGQRTLPLEMAVLLWKLVFSQLQPSVLERWLNFLEKHSNIRGIPRDTWDMFLNFSEQVGDDLSFYDDTEAWPSLLDDFVEFENDLQNQNVKV